MAKSKFGEKENMRLLFFCYRQKAKACHCGLDPESALSYSESSGSKDKTSREIRAANFVIL